jgi:hypothetical protein
VRVELVVVVLANRWKVAALILAACLWLPARLPAQSDGQPPEIFPAVFYTRPAADPTASPDTLVDPQVRPASGCASCGLPAPHDNGICPAGCGHCLPGRHCTGCGDDETFCGRILNGFYYNLCCPDPCYQPRWVPEANAAFFQDGPRPVTTTRIRWDSAFNFAFPDTAEFFWAQIAGKGPRNPTDSIHYNALSLYQEVAAKGASLFVEMPYFSVLPDNDPSAAGFGDMNIGVKTVLLDRELLLVSTEFRTFIPIGATTRGIGVGHVSLEFALLAALKLTSCTYLQMEVADWIPIAGTPGFAGMTVHYHLSLNQRLCHFGDCFNILATCEFNGFSYRGEYTAFNGAVIGLAGSEFYSAGPGLRFQWCEKVDVGIGAAFGFGNLHGPEQLYRTEFRLRF